MSKTKTKKVENVINESVKDVKNVKESVKKPKKSVKKTDSSKQPKKVTKKESPITTCFSVIPSIQYIKGDRCYALVGGKITELEVLYVNVKIGDLYKVEDAKKGLVNMKFDSSIEYITTHGKYSSSDLFESPRSLAEALVDDTVFLS